MAESAKFTNKIQSVLGGISPSLYFGSQGQFHASIGVDPDMPISDSAVRVSGFLRPTAMEKFSSTALDGYPMWLLTNPKSTDIYSYQANGDVVSYNSSLASETLVSAISTASGNGAGYYDNYHYFARNADIARYGPLNGSPSITASYWVGSLSLTALTNATYPTIRGISMPNHVMHRHLTDDRLYFCDTTSDGRGLISFIKTTKTTVEGDTNNGSTYNALDFDYGLWPTTIESYGASLAVALIEGTSGTIRQTNAKMTFWDTTSSSFQQITTDEFPDPLITAVKNVNGILWVFSGSPTGGCRISRYVGGYSHQEVAYLEDCYPPMQGAVDHLMNRIIFGTATTYPEASASVIAIGSKLSKLGGGVQNILKTTSAGANQLATAVKYVQNSSLKSVQPIVGWGDDSAKGIDKVSTTYGTSVWRSEVFRPGKPFQINKISIPLAQAVAANMTATVKLFLDDDTSTAIHTTTINTTNYGGSQKNIVIKPNIRGLHSYFLEIRWTGSALMTVGLPITIEGEVFED